MRLKYYASSVLLFAFLAVIVSGCASDAEVERLQGRVAELEQQLATTSSVPPTPSPTPTEDEKLRDSIRPHMADIAALMALLSELRDTGVWIQQFKLRCTEERIAAIESASDLDGDEYCRESREPITAARQNFVGLGGQWDRGWKALPRLGRVRDLADKAVELYDSYLTGLLEGYIAEEEYDWPLLEPGVPERLFERSEQQKDFAREIGDRYQDLLLFVGD